ncbi:hypothetical protein PHYSODRAFT_299479 [Phytophthora sojae]|uniref:Uncharacterized protein n=1 Tax=Phytophthora sojae (strain P6497) TaxID=1094619 RepID=G4Z9C7_PHYSP|nr:hypothetical protein PHYSODRAFT_299479 [Phytophthora sojae]EGZ21928.1 hypothetical protein PHYSODRAFT_299479 [Phytophthora sojae]|eukprot:XP_009524645.1 hypothetical protein PHYSODRAFT_299479 [Phytophthora sojae]
MQGWSPVQRRSSITPGCPPPSDFRTNSPRRSLSSFVLRAFAPVRVQPAYRSRAPAPDEPSKMLTRFQVLVGLYHWLTCIFIIGLVCSQLLRAVWDSTTTHEHVLYGRSPLLGLSQIVGSNDVPYADRVIACVGKGRFYEPKLVSSLLAAPGESAVLEDSTGISLTAYRLKQRRSGSVSDALDSTAYPIYAKSCELMADTIENIFAGCTALGYSNLTQDNLRVDLYKLPHTLPILIMPYWDNAIYARHAIPTWGGDACIFRLEGAYTGEQGIASFLGVNLSVHHERTLQWLGRTGGYWKNGWYEDTEGIRWYSDVKSSWRGGQYNMMHRQFDMRSEQEVDCSDPNNCEVPALVQRWGDKFSSTDQPRKISSISIANGTEFGVFMYESFAGLPKNQLVEKLIDISHGIIYFNGTDVNSN